MLNKAKICVGILLILASAAFIPAVLGADTITGADPTADHFKALKIEPVMVPIRFTGLIGRLGNNERVTVILDGPNEKSNLMHIGESWEGITLVGTNVKDNSITVIIKGELQTLRLWGTTTVRVSCETTCPSDLKKQFY